MRPVARATLLKPSPCLLSPRRRIWKGGLHASGKVMCLDCRPKADLDQAEARIAARLATGAGDIRILAFCAVAPAGLERAGGLIQSLSASYRLQSTGPDRRVEAIDRAITSPNEPSTRPSRQLALAAHQALDNRPTPAPNGRSCSC